MATYAPGSYDPTAPDPYATGPTGSGGSPNTGPLDLSQYISGVTDRAYKNWGRSADQYKWAQDQYNKDRAITERVQGRALDTQDKFARYGDEDRAFWEGTYKPAMQRQMDYATQYGSPERMEANRGAAIAQSNLAQQGAANAAKQNLMSFGIDPSAGRYAGLDAGLAANRAMHAAAAGTKSDRDTELLGQQYLANAIQTGASLPGQVANQAGVGLAAGNQAVNAGLATTASGSSTMGTPLQWAGLGNDMYNQWMRAATAETDAGLRGQELDLKRQEMKSKESSGAGAAIGAGMGILGTVAGSYFGGPLGGMLGGQLGKVAGGAAGGGGSGSGFTFRAGGMVRPPDGDDDDESPGEVHRGYRPGEDVDPQSEELMQPKAWREPHKDMRFDAPESDTSDQWNVGDEPTPEELHKEADRHRQKWVPNYAEGGSVLDNIPDYITPFDPEGEGYDYKSAREAGLQPEYNPTPAAGDPGMRWPGREPGSGLQLKGRRHPTFDHGIEQDRQQGYGLEKQNGRYYTQQFAEGGEVDDETYMGEMDAEMEAEDPIPEGGDQVVTPEMSPSGGADTDDVHALLNEGEFVIPQEVVRWHGEKFFQKLIQKAHDEMAGPQEAEPEEGPPLAMAIAPPTFRSGEMNT